MRIMNNATSITIPGALSPLIEAFRRANVPCYIVGGFVRNALLRKPPFMRDYFLPEPTDIDCAAPIAPDAAIALLLENNIPFIVKQATLGTLGIQLQETQIEFTPFRTESYPPDGSHMPSSIAFTADIREDALRRDFTVNALYADIETGEIADPLGGLADLEAHTLRACRQNAVDTFRDDGLRLLRLVRLASMLGFSVEQETLSAAALHIGNLRDIPAPRIASELTRILTLSDDGLDAGAYYDNREAYRAFGIANALRLLDETGALSVLIPEFDATRGVAQKKRYHAHDVFLHSIHAVTYAPPTLHVRLAALLHDIGKPHAIAGDGTMRGHDKIGVSLAAEILPRLGFSNDVTDYVCRLILHHMFDLDGNAKVSTCRIRFANWGFSFVRDLIALRKADVDGSGVQSGDTAVLKWTYILNGMVKSGAIDDMRALAVTGDDIMEATGLGAGKLVGRIKQLLFDAVAVDPRMNEYDRLLLEAKRLAASIQLPAER